MATGFPPRGVLGSSSPGRTRGTWRAVVVTALAGVALLLLASRTVLTPATIGVPHGPGGDIRSPADDLRNAPPTTAPETAPAEPPLNIAVTVLVTTSTKTPDLQPTVDSMLVLRQSVLASSHGPGPLSRPVNVTFVALVTPDVDGRIRVVLRWAGFDVRVTSPPLEPSDIRNAQIAKEVVTDGAMGIAEMVKIEGFAMREFDLVVMVDADVFFHQHIGHVATAFAAQPGAALGWTKGGWEMEKINGGFLVFDPAADGRRHYNTILEILKEGDFRSGSGWKGKVGWTYGGRTIQGLLPYYFFFHLKAAAAQQHQHQPQQEHPAGERDGDDVSPPPAASLAKLANGSTTRYDVKLDRCRFNNMVQLEPCKRTPFEDVVSNHFTGECLKPWWCQAPKHPLCKAFTQRWWAMWGAVRDDVRQRLRRQGDAALRKAASSLGRNTPGCGGYLPISRVLMGVSGALLPRDGAAVGNVSAGQPIED